MSTLTPNFNLIKPDSTDPFGDFRQDYNDNMDIIDANLGGGGGSGGHTILDGDGNALPQEDDLQFTGAVSVSDDNVNGRTVINVVACKEVTQAEYDALPASKLTDDIAYFIVDGESDEYKDKADKSDLASIQITGSTNDTGSTITDETYFYLNGSLVRAKTDIPNGATLTLNTNYEEVTAGALNNERYNLGTRVNINSYSSTSNMYTFPCDGYVMLAPSDSTKTGIIYVFGSNSTSTTRCAILESLNGIIVPLYVRKNMKCYCTGTANHFFVPFA